MLGSRAGRMKIDESPFPLKPGGQSAVVPPGPVPNPEVKRCRANGSRTIGPARVGRRRDFFPSGPASLQTRGACSLLLARCFYVGTEVADIHREYIVDNEEMRSVFESGCFCPQDAIDSV